jgi:phage-related protein
VPEGKIIVWLHGEVKTPPMSAEVRIKTGFLLRQLQQGEKLSMPHSRPMPSIGKNCHELRVRAKDGTWRLFYRVDKGHIIVLDVVSKKTQRTPQSVLKACMQRLKTYDAR